MTPNEYLDQAKAAMKVTSDYALANRFETTKQEIWDIRKGRKPLPIYLCVKIAITLGLDPTTVIADNEAQSDKNPKRAEFWKSFLSHASKATRIMLAVIYFGILGLGLGATGGTHHRGCRPA